MGLKTSTTNVFTCDFCSYTETVSGDYVEDWLELRIFNYDGSGFDHAYWLLCSWDCAANMASATRDRPEGSAGGNLWWDPVVGNRFSLLSSHTEE